jgi:hypothetical protein
MTYADFSHFAHVFSKSILFEIIFSNLLKMVGKVGKCAVTQ